MSYRQVNSSLWTGEVSLQLAGNLDAWAVTFYILTGPESCASSIGVFRLPISTMAEALGVPTGRASEGLRDVCRTGFAAYDEVFKMCWVKEAARHQYGESPNLKDNRVKALVAALPGLLSVARKSLIWNDFHDRYGEPWAHVFEAVGEGLPEGFGRASEGLRDRVGSLDPRSEILDPDPREEKALSVDDPQTDRSTAGDSKTSGNGFPSKASQDFDRFLALMPKGTRARQGQAAARKLWEKLKAADRDIDEALAWAQAAVKSEQWTKEAGQYVPALARIIREKRWKDGTDAFTSGRLSGRAGAVMVRRDEAADELRRQRQKGPQNVS